MNGQQVERLTGHGAHVLYVLPASRRVAIRGFIPNGIAVAPNGAIYLDTYSGNGYAATTALIASAQSGKARVIWKS